MSLKGKNLGMRGSEKKTRKKKKIRSYGEDRTGPPEIIKKMGGGSLKNIPAGNKGLPNLPTATRNKMGFKKAGGPVVKKMGGGSMNPKKYMNKGGLVKRRSGGKIKNRNMGGVIGGGLASQNVIDYLYNRDS